MPDGTALSAVPVVSALMLMTASLYSDLRDQRIPNMITVPFACGGLVFHSIASGLSGGGINAFQGMVVGCLVLLVPFILGGMGGGDVKCLGALGAWMGPERIFWIFLYGAIAGGIMAFILLVRLSGKEGFRGLFLYFKTGFLIGRLPETSSGDNRFPYTIPITIGLVTFLLIGKVAP